MAKSSGGSSGGSGVRQDYKKYVRAGKAQAGSWWKPMPFSRYAALAGREKAMREAMDLNRG